MNKLLSTTPIFVLSKGYLRYVSNSAILLVKANKLPPRPKIIEEEIQEVFIKGGGNGGQKINKTNSKVQLKHIPTGIVVSSQFSRSREDNRKRAREILALKVEQLTAEPGQSRTAIVDEYQKKKVANRKRKSKRKYKKLAEGKLAGNEGEKLEEREAEEENEGEEKLGQSGVEDEMKVSCVDVDVDVDVDAAAAVVGNANAKPPDDTSRNSTNV